MTIFNSLNLNPQHRWQDYQTANNWLSAAERIPVCGLLICLIFPLFFNTAPLSDWQSFVWWLRAWLPVGLGSTFILYGLIILRLAPSHLHGAAVEAMTHCHAELINTSPHQSQSSQHLVAWEQQERQTVTLAVNKAIQQRLKRRPSQKSEPNISLLRTFPASSKQDPLI